MNDSTPPAPTTITLDTKDSTVGKDDMDETDGVVVGEEDDYSHDNVISQIRYDAASMLVAVTIVRRNVVLIYKYVGENNVLELFDVLEANDNVIDVGFSANGKLLVLSHSVPFFSAYEVSVKGTEFVITACLDTIKAVTCVNHSLVESSMVLSAGKLANESSEQDTAKIGSLRPHKVQKKAE